MHYFYPPTLPNAEENPAWMQFDFFERKSPKDSKPIGTVQLYMPDSASQPSTVSWDSEALGLIGNIATGNHQAGFWGSIGNMLEAAGTRIGANVLSKGANMIGGNLSAEQVMGARSGKVPNPYLTMMFKGVNFRSFQYQFKFFPFTESDCDMIDNIVRTFRAHSLPPGEAGSPFLKYPSEVEIKYMWKGKPNKWLHAFKRCAITSIDVNYTPNNMFSVMRNGFPSCVHMNVGFTELEIVLRDDVEKGKNGVKY